MEGMKPSTHEHVACPPLLLQRVVPASHGKGFWSHRFVAGTKQVRVMSENASA